MTHNLVTQLNYLISHFSKTFLGFSPENLIIVDKSKFVYLCDEFLLDIIENEENEVLIKFPFGNNDFFWAPELSLIKEIPSFVNYKVSYYSLGYLILYTLLGDDNFIKDDGEEIIIKDKMSTITIKNTKLYWLLERCLIEEPKNRSILFI